MMRTTLILKLFNTRPYGQAVKTPPFHGGIPGSNPGRVTIMTYHHLRSKWNEGQTSRRFKSMICQQADAYQVYISFIHYMEV